MIAKRSGDFNWSGIWWQPLTRQPNLIDVSNSLPMLFQVFAKSFHVPRLEIDLGRIKLQVGLDNQDCPLACLVEHVFNPNRYRVAISYHQLAFTNF